MKYICSICGWEYDEVQGYPEGSIPAGTLWDNVADTFTCPLCGVGKDMFSESEQTNYLFDNLLKL